ncbi:MAG: hypothetical protein ACJZ8K_03560 [Paracoccaceae bacterium]
MVTQEKLEELVNALSKEILEWELKAVIEKSSSSSTSVAPKSHRKNQRTEEALGNFNHAISWFLREIDKHIRKVPNHELMVQLRSGYYSKKIEKKGPRLTYRQVKAVYDGLLALSYIEEETKGGYSKERGRGQSTRFKPTLSMLERINLK